MTTMRLPGLARDLREGRLSPVEHVEDVLERLAGDTCNAVVELDADGARRRAAELTAAGPSGPLHGVAVGVKDVVDVAGLPTRCGSAILAGAPPAAADAPVVALLRAAGAVIVGKLHTHEFAYGPTGDTAANGPARNPRDPSRITGGSSSGSAAAVAAGHLALTVGTDTGGSVRIPAALCGVAGLKPTRAGLPGGGLFPVAESFDTAGLLAADVASVAYAWDAVGTPDGVDRELPGLRVGVPTDEYWRPEDPALSAAVEDAARALERAGARVVPVSTPGVDELYALYATIGGSEVYATHEGWFRTRREEYQAATAARIASNAGVPAAVYIEAQRTRHRLVAELLAHVGASADVLLTPTTRTRAVPLGTDARVWSSLLALTAQFNIADRPAVSVPVDRPGLPAGVQIAGITVGTSTVLRAAAAVSGPSPADG